MNKKLTFPTNTILARMFQGGKQKKFQMPMVVMISVLATTLILSGTSHAYALQSLGESSSIGRTGPDHFGLATKGIVCGDHLCQNAVKPMPSITAENFKTMQKAPTYSPSITTEQVYKFSKQAKDTYIAVFKVNGGDKNLSKVQVLIQSDRDKTTVPIDGLFTEDHQVVEIRIHATDPQSIMAYPVSWQLSN